MPRLLLMLTTFIASDLLKKILLGAGIGLASGMIFKTVLNIFIDKMIVSLGGVGGQFLQLCGLFGLDKCLSIIIGALAMRAAIMAMQISFTKA